MSAAVTKAAASGLCISPRCSILDRRDECDSQSQADGRGAEGVAGTNRRRERRATSRVHSHVGEGARLAPAKAGRNIRRNPHRRSRESLGDFARRIGESAADRRAHRFGAERRLARWLPGHARRRRDSSAPERAISRQAAGHGAPGGLGRRRRRAVRQEPLRFVGLLGQSRHGRSARLERQGRHHPSRRARSEWNRFREGEGLPQGAGERRGLSRVAHRTGSGAARSGSAARRPCSEHSASSVTPSLSTVRPRIPAARR